MPYINFKEEVTVAKQQLSHRMDNNEKLCKQISNDKSCLQIKPDEKYSFRHFEERTINNSKTQNEEEFCEISNKNIICSKFMKCKFYNIKFKNCTFVGCNFVECDFGGGGVIFENCSFILQEIKNVPSLNVKDNLSCSFERCKIYSKFLSTDITYVIINECYLKDTNFEMTDMTSTIIINSEMKKIDIVDADLSGVKIVNTYIEDLEFNDKLQTKIDEKTFIDKIEPREKTKSEYEGLYMVYETIANKFNGNNLKNNFGEYYYLCKTMQRKSLKKGLPKITSYIYWLTCGYGERILYPLMSSLVMIVIFTILYLAIGLDMEGEIISYIWRIGIPHNLREFMTQLNWSLNLSVEVFTGLGADNATTIPISYMICNVEMVIGVIMMGVGIGTLTRKLVR
ncbi:MAG: pentapeptide repeat-containing protein [Clostridium sp.]|uniref:pentapeptide repeat-containing protein n=1 Tax=Clostridium sp. TaxID=1506 RepID=UPI003064FB52